MKFRLTQSHRNLGFQHIGGQKGAGTDELAKTLVFARGAAP